MASEAHEFKAKTYNVLSFIDSELSADFTEYLESEYDILMTCKVNLNNLLTGVPVPVTDHDGAIVQGWTSSEDEETGIRPFARKLRSVLCEPTVHTVGYYNKQDDAEEYMARALLPDSFLLKSGDNPVTKQTQRPLSKGTLDLDDVKYWQDKDYWSQEDCVEEVLRCAIIATRHPGSEFMNHADKDVPTRPRLLPSTELPLANLVGITGVVDWRTGTDLKMESDKAREFMQRPKNSDAASNDSVWSGAFFTEQQSTEVLGEILEYETEQRRAFREENKEIDVMNTTEFLEDVSGTADPIILKSGGLEDVIKSGVEFLDENGSVIYLEGVEDNIREIYFGKLNFSAAANSTLKLDFKSITADLESGVSPMQQFRDLLALEGVLDGEIIVKQIRVNVKTAYPNDKVSGTDEIQLYNVFHDRLPADILKSRFSKDALGEDAKDGDGNPTAIGFVPRVHLHRRIDGSELMESTVNGTNEPVDNSDENLKYGQFGTFVVGDRLSSILHLKVIHNRGGTADELQRTSSMYRVKVELQHCTAIEFKSLNENGIGYSDMASDTWPSTPGHSNFASYGQVESANSVI